MTLKEKNKTVADSPFIIYPFTWNTGYDCLLFSFTQWFIVYKTSSHLELAYLWPRIRSKA